MDKANIKTPLIVFSTITSLLLLYYLSTYFYLFETDAYIESHVVKVSPEVSGIIQNLYVKDLERVKKGQALFKIDPTRYQAKLNDAKATLLNARQDYQALMAKKQAAIEAIKRAKASMAFQTKQFKRYTSLAGGAVISIEKKQQVIFYYQQAVANLAIAEANLSAIKASLGDESKPYAPIVKAQAVVKLAQYNLDRTVYKSSVNGYVTASRLRIGDMVTRGEKLFALIDEEEWWVLAKVKESYLPYLQTKNPVTIWLPSQQGSFDGTVSGIAWGVDRIEASANSKDWVLPYFRQTEHWIQLAQRFPVKIRFNSKGKPLHFGANARVLIHLS